MINNLVFNNDGQVLTTSRMVADYFSKEHKNIIRDIRKIMNDFEESHGSILSHENYFIESTYKSSRGRIENQYLLTKDGFVLLAMGFTGKKALEFKIDYINAYNAMEQALITRREEDINHAMKLANRNKEYNKKVNVLLRREIKELKKEYDEIMNKVSGLENSNYELQEYANNLNTYIDGLEDNLRFYEPKQEEWFMIPIHGFSNNYMYTPDVTEYGTIRFDTNGNPKVKKSNKYKKWIKKFNDKAKGRLPELDVDFNKRVGMWLFFEHKGIGDVTNYIKSAIDQICREYGVDDKCVELMACRTHGDIVNNYAEGKIWYCIKNI